MTLDAYPSGMLNPLFEGAVQAVEQIQVITAELAAEVFGARFAEIRVHCGAMANLCAFMATCSPGDRIIVPPGQIGGHMTHHLHWAH